MAKTRRDLLAALRQKLREAVSGDPELMLKWQARLAAAAEVAGRPALDALGEWLDAPISDEEFERQLAATHLSPKLLHKLFDPQFFPPRDRATIAGSN